MKGLGTAALAVALFCGAPQRAYSQDFPAEGSYRALRASAQSNGYGEIAQGVDVFLNYRRGLETCAKENAGGSSKEFGAFLDSIVGQIHGYMSNTSSLRRRAARESVGNYVTQCMALLQLYLQEKTEKKEGSASRMTDADERLLRTARSLHAQVGSALRVGMPSVEATAAQWKRADLNGYQQDGRYGHGAMALMTLRQEAPALYCHVA